MFKRLNGIFRAQDQASSNSVVRVSEGLIPKGTPAVPAQSKGSINPAPSNPNSNPAPTPEGRPPASSHPNPTLAEFLALLHSQHQQLIENLANPALHQISEQHPSSAFVKIEKVKINLPINAVVESVQIPPYEKVKVSAEEYILQHFKLLERPIILGDGKTASIMRVSLVDAAAQRSVKDTSMISVEFSVAAKMPSPPVASKQSVKTGVL
jgi:hypothetical protein